MNEEKQPLFTIGIASYNYANYLVKALDAVKNQDFDDYEILISDDASTDNSIQVIEEYIHQNPQLDIRLIQNLKNLGLIENKNKLIENCRGKYLILCDADDYMEEGCLQKIAEKIFADDPDRVIVEVAHVDLKGNIIQIEHIPDHQTKWGWNMHHGCANRVSILKEHDIRIFMTPDDVNFTIEFSKYCRKISIVHEVLYNWVVHTDSEGRKKKHIDEKIVEKNFGRMLEYIGNTISYVKNRNDDNASRDIEELRLIMLKLYYFTIFFNFQNVSLTEKWFYFKILRRYIRKIDPQYLSNSLLSLKKEACLRPYCINAIRLGVFLEKCHLMPLGLLGYHLICQFKYFDQ